MVSIQRAVEDELSDKPFVQEALARGIVNYAALAESLEDRIVRIVRKPVKRSAVMMALRRLHEKLEAREPLTNMRFESSLQLRDGLVELTIEKSERTVRLIESIMAKIDYVKGDFLTVTQGIYEITLITDAKSATWIEPRITEDQLIGRSDDLSSLTLFVPESAQDVPGFFFVITRELAWENVSIKEIVSTEHELSVIVRSAAVPKAFETVQRLTKRYRQD